MKTEITCKACTEKAALSKSFYSRDLQKEITLFHCPHCETVFVHPTPTGKEFQLLYPTNYYEKPSPLLSFLQKRRGNIFPNKKNASVLDVGCGSGFFVEEMARKGWSSYGCDVSEESKKCWEQNIFHPNVQQFFFAEMPDIKTKKQFDCITYWQVFEHLADPVTELNALKRVLKKDGYILLSIPNQGSASRALFGSAWFHLDVPRHLFFFSPSSITRLLNQHGFRVTKISHWSLEYNPFGVFQSIYNSLGFRHNFFYDLLRKRVRAIESHTTIAYTIGTLILLPLVLPISLILTVLFSFAKRGDTILVWAEKV